MGRTLQGIGVSSGVAVGRVQRLEPGPVPVVAMPIPPERVDREIARFSEARDRCRRELDGLEERVRTVLGDPFLGVLDAQRLILDDPALVAETEQRIRIGRVAASWALRETVDAFLRRFASFEDTYFRERGGDLADVHRRLQRALRGVASDPPEERAGPVVVVAHTLGAAEAFSLVREGVVGLATDAGGRTSHTAILAQALGLPAVVGLHEITRWANAGDRIVLDGESGRVELLPDAGSVARATEARAAWIARQERLAETRDLPARTRDGIDVEIRANIEFLEEVRLGVRFGAKGIGLYRSEFLFLSRAPEFPSEEEHYAAYLELAQAVAPDPAVVRTFDLGGEKYFHDVLDRGEPNPVLGLRGIRLCLERPDIFRPQLRALLRVAARADVRILLPLVTEAGEVREARRILSEEAAALERDRIEARADVPIGIMIEVPGAALAADLLAREADFLSIGTNDLIQYALAVDRGNESVARLYQPLHPAILRMMAFVVRSGRSAGIPVALCGEMAADPTLAPLLVGLGLRELSLQPRAIPAIRAAVREIEGSRAQALAEAALQGVTAEDVLGLLRADGRA